MKFIKHLWFWLNYQVHNIKLETRNFKLFPVILFASSCANIVTPTGGPKDVKPPLVTKAVPQNESTRFTGNIITIEFDEYIKLDNPSQEIVISPAIEPEPQLKLKGRRLELGFKEAQLDSNTTYVINFGEALKDVNESNPLSGFQYVFSTGEKLDSLSLTGRVMLAESDKPASKMLVMLHKELTDSAFIKTKPFYFARTDDNGSFRLNYIRQGDYRLHALKDENYNYRYDLPNEQIAFIDSIINIHYNIDSVRLNLFSEERDIPLKRTGMNDSKPGYVRLIYSKEIDTIAITSFTDGLPVALPEYSKTRDTITAWYTRVVEDDSFQVVVNDSMEALVVRNIPGKEDSLKSIYSAPAFAAKDSLVGVEGIIAATLKLPLVKALFDSVTIEQDSPRLSIQPTHIRLAEGSPRRLELNFSRKPDRHYAIVFPAGVFTDLMGNSNDTLVWRVKTKADEDYGYAKISVRAREGSYMMQIINVKTEELFREFAFSGDTLIELPKIIPGMYELRIVYDANANGRWDTGNFLRHLQPERTYAHPEKLNVRANWEMEVELKLW